MNVLKPHLQAAVKTLLGKGTPEKYASLSQVNSTGQAPEEYASLSQVPQINENQRIVERGKNSTPVQKFLPMGRAGQGQVIESDILEKERESDFELKRVRRFRYRTRYFTDSGIIGTKEFVSENYQRFKNIFSSKHEKKPKPIKGLDGMYSLKRLSEVI
jgi:hypothetical protein